MKKLFILCIFHLMISPEIIFADVHSSRQEQNAQQHQHQHSEDEGQEHQHRDEVTEDGKPSAEHSEEDESAEITYEGLFAPFGKFPNLHPLFVHFPVVLIPVALLFQIIALFWYRKAMGIAVIILLSLGTAGGLLASFWFHPHVGELPVRAQEVFLTHERYAYRTLGLAGAASVLKIISFFFSDRNRIAETAMLLLLAAATYTVSVAGHLGSQLVFIEEVGPKGKNLRDHSAGEHSH